MSLRDRIYQRLPIELQHAAVTLRGARLRRLRHTEHTWRTLELLERSERWSRRRLEDYQGERLAELVRHACLHSPWYRDRYRRAGIDPASIGGLDDLPRLPVVGKEELREANQRFVAQDVPRRRMWLAHTSGTTGTPLLAYHRHEDMQARAAYMERLFRWYNPRPLRRRASFTGRLIVPPDDFRGPFHRDNRALNQQLYSCHHLRPGFLESYIEELAEFAPEQLDGISSAMYVLADHLVLTGQVGRVRPIVAVATSETVWPTIEARIREGFATTVAKQYGSQEGAPIAYECAQGGFHTCAESGIFEVLRPDGSPAAPGEMGRLVVTSFLSFGMPLIRYDIGDLAWTLDGQCACGRTLPLLGGIEGRIDDMFFSSERGIVSRVDSAFKGLPATVLETQVAQVARDSFEVRLVAGAGYREAHGEMLVENLRRYLGRSVAIEVRRVRFLPRTAGGKVRAMVNECREELSDEISEAWNDATPSAIRATAGDPRRRDPVPRHEEAKRAERLHTRMRLITNPLERTAVLDARSTPAVVAPSPARDLRIPPAATQNGRGAQLRRLARRVQPLMPRRGKGLLIVAYHLVGAGTRSIVDMAPHVFRRQMEELARTGEVLPLDEALERLPTGGRAVALTFDDAYRNFHQQVWPILRELGLPATLYVPTGFIDGDFPDPLRLGLPPLSWRELREMADQGLTVGSHTVSHANLRRLPPAEVERELRQSRERLEEELGRPVAHFAYPRALAPRQPEEPVRHLYRSATIAGGVVNGRSAQRHRLHRVPLRRDMPESLGLVLDHHVVCEEWLASQIRDLVGSRSATAIGAASC